jgi:hypothetical protein
MDLHIYILDSFVLQIWQVNSKDNQTKTHGTQRFNVENHCSEKGKNHGRYLHYMRECLHDVGDLTDATYPM